MLDSMPSTAEERAPAPPAKTATDSGYIVGPVYDMVFFLYAPLLALVLGILVDLHTQGGGPLAAGAQGGDLQGVALAGVVEADLGRINFLQTGNHSEQGRLAGTGWPKQGGNAR